MDLKQTIKKIGLDQGFTYLVELILPNDGCYEFHILTISLFSIIEKSTGIHHPVAVFPVYGKVHSLHLV